MKNLIKFTTIIFALVLMFSSCKKEEMSLLNPELSLSGDDTKLTIVEKQLSINGKIAPEDAVDGKITLKITSQADPTGFEISLDLSDGDFTDSGVKYLYKSFVSSVYASNHTSADSKMIKVAETGDIIKVTVGSDIISKTFQVDCSEVLSYSFMSSEGIIFLYGYNYDGTENKTVEVWSSRDDQHIPLTGVWDDPSQYGALPSFTDYSFDVNYVDGWSSEENKQVGIYPEGDTLFVSYGDKIYYSVYNQSSPVMQLY